MVILGIETSCDETAAAVLLKDLGRVKILSNIVASSASLQAKYGGIIPEQAAREQVKAIIPVVLEALKSSQITADSLDAVAVTQGPGLIGSLLVGVETAKVLATIWKKPLIPVNHPIGHFYANWIVGEDLRVKTPSFPCLGLLVSGGHTDLVLFEDHGKFNYIGGTRDDAAGECFDKCARLLGLPYPGGPQISKLAEQGNPKAYNLPRPMLDSNNFDFSFSGLKTAVSNLVSDSDIPDASGFLSHPGSLQSDLAASIQQAIIDCLVIKTINAAKKYGVKQLIVAGGVAANRKLVSDLQLSIANFQLPVKLFVPPPALCTDNAAMIASAAFFNHQTINLLDLQANPNLSLAY